MTRVTSVNSQVEQASPRELAWRVNLYRGYLAIYSPEDPHLAMVDRWLPCKDHL